MSERGRSIAARLWIALALAACSGDSHPPTTPPAPTAPVAAPTAPDAAPPAPPPPPQPAPLSEDMAAPYFQTGDAAVGARAFALEKWAEARAAFTAARAGAKGDDAARLDLMLGLTHARLAEWPKAAEHLDAALRGVPLLADYIRYQAARARYFASQFDR